jgi:hypothetical protein
MKKKIITTRKTTVLPGSVVPIVRVIKKKIKRKKVMGGSAPINIKTPRGYKYLMIL